MQKNEFTIGLSIYYLAFILIGVVVSVFVVVLLAIKPMLKILGVLIVLLYGANILWNSLSLVRIKYTPATGKWILQTRRKVYEGVLRGDSTVTSIVSILRFRLEDHFMTKSHVVFKDALQPAEYRQLLVILRMY